MTGGLLATLLATSSSEFSPKFNIAAETGMLEHSDPHWELIDSWQEPSGGLRFGYNLSPKLGLVGSFHRALSSSAINYGSDNYDYDSGDSSGLGTVEVQMTESLITIGPKISFGSNKWFVPYATVQGLAAIGMLEMGDNPRDAESTTYLKDTAAGFGALGALGIELRTRPISGKFQPIMYVEYGGGFSSALNFSAPGIGVGGDDMPIGDLKYGGEHFRFGLGTQF